MHLQRELPRSVGPWVQLSAPSLGQSCLGAAVARFGSAWLGLAPIGLFAVKVYWQWSLSVSPSHAYIYTFSHAYAVL